MSAINFNTSNLTFRQLLGNGLTYRVPPFQRDYSWTEDEWDDLWQDIQGLFEEDGEAAHYMGYLVLQSSDNKRFDIIDGQQRITTISIMILAVLRHFQELVTAGLDADDNLRRKEQLQNSYIGYVDPVTLVPQSKLVLNRHNDNFYQHYLVPQEKIPQRGLNLSEHQLRKSFLWFYERVKSRFGMTQDTGKMLAGFLDNLVDKLFFTVITVTDELNAFKVFETLNARGVRLSSTDLLKNYLFSVISSEGSHETELKALEDRWEHIVGLLGSESFPEFLRVYWNSQNKLARKSDLFKTIRKRISTRETAFELLRQLDYFAGVYAALRDPQDNLWNDDEQIALQKLQMYNVRQPFAMLMACYGVFHETDRQVFTRILRAIAIISFRYNVICNFPAHDQERIYNDIAIQVSAGNYTSVHQILSALAQVYPDDEQFRVAFADKELKTTNNRNKRIVRYILVHIENQTSNVRLDFDSDKYNVEHILPERAGDGWEHIDEVKQERLVYRLGNMTLLEAAKNRDLGNTDYSSKRDAYLQSAIATTVEIAETYHSWDEHKILSRQTSMAKMATGIWRINF